MFLFTKAIPEGKQIDVFNYDKMQRDFTYIDDIVKGVVRTNDHTAKPNPAWNSEAPNPATSKAPYRVYNTGINTPDELMYLIETIEKSLGRVAEKRMLPLQPGDVPATYANVDALVRDVGYAPKTPIETGVANFVGWYREYFQIGD
jgi:UDP-glucuronate 4-epimerase